MLPPNAAENLAISEDSLDREFVLQGRVTTCRSENRTHSIRKSQTNEPGNAGAKAAIAQSAAPFVDRRPGAVVGAAVEDRTLGVDGHALVSAVEDVLQKMPMSAECELAERRPDADPNPSFSPATLICFSEKFSDTSTFARAR